MRVHSLRELAVLALMLASACTGGQGGDPGTSPDSGVTGGTGGMGGSGGVGGSGAGGASGMGPSGGSGGMGGLGGTGGCLELDSIGVGLVSADLDTDAPLFEPLATLDGNALPHALRMRPGGLLVQARTGFWDIDHGAEPAWVEGFGNGYAMWSVDLDGDEDVDLVTHEHVVDDDSDGGVDDGDEGRNVLQVWERLDDELVARAELMGTQRADKPLPDEHAVGDVDDDGDPDLVTFDRGYVFVQRNEGALAFTRVEASAVVEDHVAGWQTSGVSIADRNGDDVQDVLVVAYRLDTPNDTDSLVFLGDGEGKFLAPTISELGSFAVYSALLGDVTGDGLADAVMQTAFGKSNLAESLSATSFAAARPLDHDAFSLQLVDFDQDGTLDIAGLTHEQLFVDIALGAGAFESRRFDVSIRGFQAFEITPPQDDEPAGLHAVYRIFCPKPCDSGCHSCVFDACVECLTHTDCTQGLCVDNVCVEGEPLDSDAGEP